MFVNGKYTAIACQFLLGVASVAATDSKSHPLHGEYYTLPPLREQAQLQNAWTEGRISNIPALLRKHGVDAWLMSQKEYAEDTVFWSLKAAEQFSARRRTLQLFLANATGDGKSAYTWIDNTATVWSELLNVLETNNPSSIAINIDTDIAFSSGLHTGEHEKIKKELGSRWSEKLVNVQMLPVEFIGTMPKGRLPYYRKLMGTAWAMIDDAFSSAVITPGVTTTEDVEWWLRSKIQQQNYTTWFQSDVSIIHQNGEGKSPSEPGVEIINYGDVLHVDFGVTAMGMNTDTQHLAYVLHPGHGEQDIPESLKAGLKTVNRLQDIVKEEMNRGIGKTGNAILKSSLAQMRSEGMEGKIYCHSIGDWGHSAGTVIGMTNLQTSVPALGDLPLLDNTYYSIELYAESFVEEFNSTMNFYQEEDVYWDDESKTWEWVWGRQERFHLIKTPKAETAEDTKGAALMVQEL